MLPERLSFFVEWSVYLLDDLHLYMPVEHRNVLQMDVTLGLTPNPLLFYTPPFPSYDHPFYSASSS